MKDSPLAAMVADDHLALDYLLARENSVLLKGLRAPCGQATLARCRRQHRK